MQTLAASFPSSSILWFSYSDLAVSFIISHFSVSCLFLFIFSIIMNEFFSFFVTSFGFCVPSFVVFSCLSFVVFVCLLVFRFFFFFSAFSLLLYKLIRLLSYFILFLFFFSFFSFLLSLIIPRFFSCNYPHVVISYFLRTPLLLFFPFFIFYSSPYPHPHYHLFYDCLNFLLFYLLPSPFLLSFYLHPSFRPFLLSFIFFTIFLTLTIILILIFLILHFIVVSLCISSLSQQSSTQSLALTRRVTTFISEVRRSNSLQPRPWPYINRRRERKTR